MNDLRELPKVRDKWSYLYVEHCKIDQEYKAIAIHDVTGKIPVPCATLSLLMLGPGTSITHAAVKTLAESGCLVVWSGEQGIRFYAQGLGESRSSSKLLQQVKLYSDPEMRLNVVMNMYKRRFSDPLPKGLNLQQIRGKEGIRVREAYAKASEETGVPWTGRSYKRNDWGCADPINRALSAANSCLYGICHSAIVSLGYSPALGFIHTGKQLSFVYDIADLYKVETTIPISFNAVAMNDCNVEKTVRKMCREVFLKQRLLNRIVEDIDGILQYEQKDDDFIDDPSKPGGIWDNDSTEIVGGMNFADSMIMECESDGSNDS